MPFLEEFRTIRARSTEYSDVDLSFQINPVTNDIAKRKDAAAVRQSVLNILLTNRGERPFDENFGANIRSLLFENFHPAMAEMVKQQVRQAIKRDEPRVSIRDIVVNDLSDQNAIEVRVEVQIKSPEPVIVEVQFTVERQR